MTRFATRLISRRARRAIDERGVTMIIFGLVIVALLIVVAIVIDLGNARQQKRQLQNAADAAALAGANDINVTGGDPCGVAVKYTYNNMRLGAVQGACSSGNYSQAVGNQNITVATPYYSGPAAYPANSLVNVRACMDVATSFARIIGVTSIHVCGNATAHKAGVAASGPPGGGTPQSDPDAPCTVDAFTANG